MCINLLGDMGRMSAENVVERHLGGRIDEPQIWMMQLVLSSVKLTC